MRMTATAETLIEDIYEAGVDAGHWPVVLGRLAGTFGSGSAHLSIDVSGRPAGDAAPRMIAHGADPAWCRRYDEYYGARNLFWDRIVERRLTGVMINTTVVPKDEARRSEFYNDFLRPQGGDEILCFIAGQRGRTGTSFTLWRADRAGPWQRADMRRLARLAPHLKRAIALNERLCDMRGSSPLTAEALSRLSDGILLTDGRGEVRFANVAAEALFADGGLRLEHRRVAAERPADTDRLHRLVADAANDGSGGSLVIARAARAPLIVLVAPLRPEAGPAGRGGRGAMLVVKDMERATARSLGAFASHFGLTAAQEALASEMLKGDGVGAAAARLGVTRATVRTQLMRLFQKTGTRRQAALVRLMLDWSGGMLRGDEDDAVTSSRR